MPSTPLQPSRDKSTEQPSLAEQKPARVNWRYVIEDLERAGLSRLSVGRATGRSAQSIRDIWRGRKVEPAFTVGNALLELWLKHAAKFPDANILEALRALPVIALSGSQTTLGSLVEMGVCEPRLITAIAARAGIEPADQ